MKHEVYEIYTDGAVSRNGFEGSAGGWAYVIIHEGKIIARDSGGELDTTNQRMELTAALNACRKMDNINSFAEVKLYSDSAYFINCYKQNWWKTWNVNGWVNSKKEPVANQDLWQGLIPFFQRTPNGYDFIKIRGHAGIYYNEMVDKMAVQAKNEVMNGKSCRS